MDSIDTIPPSAAEISTFVKQSIFGVIGIPPIAISDVAHLNRDLGMDSLDRMNVFADAEQAFGIEFSDETRESVQTVFGLIGATEHLVNQKGIAA